MNIKVYGYVMISFRMTSVSPWSNSSEIPKSFQREAYDIGSNIYHDRMIASIKRLLGPLQPVTVLISFPQTFVDITLEVSNGVQ